MSRFTVRSLCSEGFGAHLQPETDVSGTAADDARGPDAGWRPSAFAAPLGPLGSRYARPGLLAGEA